MLSADGGEHLLDITFKIDFVKTEYSNSEDRVGDSVGRGPAHRAADVGSNAGPCEDYLSWNQQLSPINHQSKNQIFTIFPYCF